MPLPTLVTPSGIFWAARVHKTVVFSTPPELTSDFTFTNTGAEVDLSTAPVLSIAGRGRSTVTATLSAAPELGAFYGFPGQVELSVAPTLEVHGRRTGVPYTVPWRVGS